MARGENPGKILPITTALTYDKNVAYGHASAGKDLAVDFNGALAGDNAQIAGKFLELHSDSEMSVDVGGNNGEPLIFRKTAVTIAAGDGLVGAGDGKVKARTETTVAGLAKVRWVCLKVLEDTEGGRILAIRA